MVTLRAIKEAYGHRIVADPITCPVCCGDRQTDDQRFGGAIGRTVKSGHPNDDHNHRTVFDCMACAVWAASLEQPETADRLPTEYTVADRLSSATDWAIMAQLDLVKDDRPDVTVRMCMYDLARAYGHLVRQGDATDLAHELQFMLDGITEHFNREEA